MGVTKKELFTSQQNELASLARVLGHPARVAILEYLVQANQCINSNLVDELGLAQATVSQHLRELKEAGLIQGTIEGTSVSYCISPQKWNAVKDLFGSFFKSYTEAQNCC